MKKYFYFALAAIMYVSCDNNQKRTADVATQFDSIMVSRVELLKEKLPKQNGALGIEECKYNGKTVVLKMRILADNPDLSSPDVLKWLPAMMLNDIHQLDTLMIKRLVELNQPLTYEVYEKNDTVLVKKFALSPDKLKGRATATKMF